MKLVRGFEATAQFQEGRRTIAMPGLGSKGSPLFQCCKGRGLQHAPGSLLEPEHWRGRSQEQGVSATNQGAPQDRDPSSHYCTLTRGSRLLRNYASKNIHGKNELRINKHKHKHCIFNGLKYGGVLKGQFPNCRVFGMDVY